MMPWPLCWLFIATIRARILQLASCLCRRLVFNVTFSEVICDQYSTEFFQQQKDNIDSFAYSMISSVPRKAAVIAPLNTTPSYFAIWAERPRPRHAYSLHPINANVRVFNVRAGCLREHVLHRRRSRSAADSAQRIQSPDRSQSARVAPANGPQLAEGDVRRTPRVQHHCRHDRGGRRAGRLPSSGPSLHGQWLANVFARFAWCRTVGGAVSCRVTDGRCRPRTSLGRSSREIAAPVGARAPPPLVIRCLHGRTVRPCLHYIKIHSIPGHAHCFLQTVRPVSILFFRVLCSKDPSAGIVLAFCLHFILATGRLHVNTQHVAREFETF
jgi:hypothetical protein